MALASDLANIGIIPRRAEMLGDTFSPNLTSAGAAQATALVLTSSHNEITTNNAGVNDGVKLPPVKATAYSRIAIKNNAVGIVKVYPYAGEAIDALALNAPYNLAAGTGAIFCKINTARWVAV